MVGAAAVSALGFGPARRSELLVSEPDGPEETAESNAEEIGREVDYQPVETDGAARAAKLIAELL